MVAVLLNTLLDLDHDAILRDSRASALFVSAALYPVVAPVLDDNPWLRTVVAAGGAAPDGTTGFDDLWRDTRPLIAAMSARMMWPSG